MAYAIVVRCSCGNSVRASIQWLTPGAVAEIRCPSCGRTHLRSAASAPFWERYEARRSAAEEF